ncbi:LANO_0G12772g1_1 [Lachancea nothofagi CBS 11611]|uniref:Coronin n=1 Tax=Lachancea nothofagi CBS 11611 TaxID=1266666 RepID=A0A1G4KJZ3_9SACH|nr:LANO_0G12772g1_1 [Lachancea nothofagi CBS 11611]
MSGKFVRASKYRHVYGQVAKKERQYENIRVTSNAWDSNLIKANSKFLAVNWNSSGGGAFAVIPLEEVGKAPDQVPLFRGHTAPVLDTDFNPFNDYCLASGSDDGKIGIWEIPQDYSFHNYADSEGEPKDLKPRKFLVGHGRKVGHVLFHPTAENVLASSSLDHTVKFWNVDSGKELFSLKHPDMVTSMSFSYNGDHLATVCRDKKMRVWEIKGEKIVSEGPAHSGAKNQRVVWLGNSTRIVTTGFSKLSDRQIGVWDAFNLEKGDLGGFYTVDQSSGILMPFYDDSNKILYVVGKGDGNIRYFEFQNDELFELSEFQSIDPQRGFAAAPRRAVSVKENEILKGFKTVNNHCIEPISFYVPRKSDSFQDDIYPDAPSGVAALTIDEWLSNKSVQGPILFNVKSLFDGSEPVLTPSSAGSLASVSSAPTSGASKSSEMKPDSENKTVSASSAEKTSTRASAPISVPVSDAQITASASTGIDDVLKEDKSVDQLLQKATQLDSVNDAEDPSKRASTWDEDEELAPPKANSAISSKQAGQSVNEGKHEKVVKSCALDGTESSQALPNEKTPIPSTIVAPEKSKEADKGAKSTLEQESISDPKNPTSVSPPAATKSMGLKQSVEKLSALVLQLDQVVTGLKQANLDKDTRLKAMEAKLEQLVQN